MVYGTVEQFFFLRPRIGCAAEFAAGTRFRPCVQSAREACRLSLHVRSRSARRRSRGPAPHDLLRPATMPKALQKA